ncbi:MULTISPECIES: hydrogenase 4 subunit H [Providencia]|uniref:hydrogenase 4 subunit H n=1 Tax=Providencia TaxID=586 RepID=UPI000837B6D2|nr:hydrogenase 4 subunit H [Providencia heimbachae]MBP6124101.1 hydrogenase 4 subunit H [Providencia sp.]NIH21891.1 hydrogenase 4 subunit H [Providencia heimbachae]
MFKLFKTLRDAGTATVKYPFKPLEVAHGFRGKPEYDPQQCIACGACISACPANALTMETDLKSGERRWQLFIGRCIYCARCEEVCPTRAIHLTEDFETAVMNKADLYIKATFRLQYCRQCGEAFAPKKSVEYAMALMVASGIEESGIEALRPMYETCPSCKQKNNLLNNERKNFRLHIEGDKS